MIDLFKAFATQDDFFYDGAFIAKVKYKNFYQNINDSINETYKNEIMKSNKRLCVINSNGYINNEIVETLTVYLMMNVTVKESAKNEAFEDVGALWRTFSKEEIVDFSHQTGDTNSIHLTDNPVVQGLLILKELYNSTKVNEIEVKYVHPIYGCSPVYLKQEENNIQGFSNGLLCFQATLF